MIANFAKFRVSLITNEKKVNAVMQTAEIEAITEIKDEL